MVEIEMILFFPGDIYSKDSLNEFFIAPSTIRFFESTNDQIKMYPLSTFIINTPEVAMKQKRREFPVVDLTFT